MARRRSFAITAMLLAGMLVGSSFARAQGGPSISALPPVIYVGDNFVVNGSGFTRGSVVNFFVATSSGAENFGPFVPGSILPDTLTVYVPTSVIQGEGVVDVEVIDTDEGHVISNDMLTLLQGEASLGLPSLTAINGVGLSPSSIEPGIALANVETVVSPGASVTLSGSGFDVSNGVGVDLFCACPGGKVGPFFLNPGNPGLTASSLVFTLPSGASGPATGPGAFRVTNLGNLSASAAVSVPVGAAMAINRIAQNGPVMIVSGTGFSSVTVMNLFNQQGSVVVNLGGLNPDGSPKIPLSRNSDGQIIFSLPAGTVPGPAYVQLLNPPFIPFTSSGNSPSGAFIAP